MIRMKSTAVAAALAAMLATTGTGTALAEDSYSDKELKSFAVALLSVQELNRKMLRKVAKAQTPEEETIARSEGQQQMIMAVQEEGLSVSKYNRLTNEVRTNPEVAEKVKQLMQEAR